MEIGPIAGIRPVTMVKPSSPTPDLSGVFAVQLRKHAHDEAPAHERAARGLEDEESDAAPSSKVDESVLDEIDADRQTGQPSRVSFFA